MSRRPLGLFDGDGDPEEIAAAITRALEDAMGEETTDPGDDADTSDVEDEPTRLDPAGGDPSKDPYSHEQLLRAQMDRLSMMAVYGMSEEDFGEEAIWLVDEDGDLIVDDGRDD